MRALLAYPMMAVMTLIYVVPIAFMTLFRIPIPPDSWVGRGGHWWSYWVLKAAGVKVVVRNPERVSRTESRVYVSNHVSWFEIFALATVIDRYRFVAKKEIQRVPLFGRAAGEVAAIYIERNNRKAAFSAYEDAAKRIRGGLNVAVYPEGTRGRSYELRPFKKGPFVLAIAAQVPIVPVISWGSKEVQAKGEMAIHSGTIELTFLEPVETKGLTYEDREAVVETVWNRIAAALEEKGVPIHRPSVAEATAASAE
ncbi:MAG: 1-acyl-sn-glycerol-3-phosphate acyltransferase [Gemmatimonadaceae bacterium]|nr:1-acyl-sn-glycerol-3-phosphate acyltransferase [Gemmatimonadaceae bacterium]